MQIRFEPIGLVSLGALLVTALRGVQFASFWSGFEDPNPPLFYRLGWLWTGLGILVPGLVIGLSAKRSSAWWLGGLAYFFGSMMSFAYHDSEHVVPDLVLPSLEYWPYLLRSFLIAGLIGTVVAMIGARLRRRLTCVGADARSRLR